MCNKCRRITAHYLPSLFIAAAAGFEAAHASRLPDDDPSNTIHHADNIALLRDLALVVSEPNKTTDEKLDPVDAFLDAPDTADLIPAAKFAYYMAELSHALAGMISTELEDRAINRNDGVAAKFMLKGVGRDIYDRTDLFADAEQRESPANSLGGAVVAVMAQHARAHGTKSPSPAKYEH